MYDLSEYIGNLADRLDKDGRYIVVKRGSILEGCITDNSVTPAIIEVVASKVVNELEFFKNIYLKECYRLSSIVDNIKKTGLLLQSAIDYDIISIKIPEAVLLLEKKGLLVAPRPANKLAASVFLSPPAEDTIRKYIKTQDTEVNTAVLNISNTLKDTELLELWNKYLTNISGTNDSILSLAFAKTMDIEKLCILYAMVLTLSESKPAYIKSITDGEYTAHMYNFANEILNFISIALHRYRETTSKQILITHIDGTNIYVNDNVYMEAIKAGVTPEAIFGLTLEAKSAAIGLSTLSNLTNNYERYLASWETFLKSKEILVDTKKLELTYNSLVQGLKEWGATVGDETKKYLEEHMDKYIANFIYNIPYSTSEYATDFAPDTDQVILENMAVLFNSEVAGKCPVYVKYLTHILKTNQGISIENALSKVIIYRLSDYFFSETYINYSRPDSEPVARY